MKQILLFTFLLFFCLAVPDKSKAQTWYPDRSFGENGIRPMDFGGSDDRVNTLLMTDQGKLLFSSAGFWTGGGVYYSHVKTARISPLCGLADSTFGNNGKTYFQLDAYNYLNHIRLQPDGKILGSGLISGGGAMSSFTPFFCRLNPNGSLDSSFRGTGYFADRFDPISGGEYFDSHIYPDGKILAIGKSYQNVNGGVLGIGLTRFLPDGTLDTSFNSNGRKVLPVYSFGPSTGFVLPGSRSIFIAAQIESGNTTFPRIAKFNHRGKEIAGFGLNGVASLDRSISGDATVFCFSQGNKMIVFFSHNNGSRTFPIAVKMDTSSGSIDSSFGVNGYFETIKEDFSSIYMRRVKQLSDGRFFVLGVRGVENSISVLYCLKPDFSVDSSFGQYGRIEYNYPDVSGEYFVDAVLPNDSTLFVLGYKPAQHGDAHIYKYTTNRNNWFFLGADRSICGNTAQTLNAGFPGSIYQWNTGATSQSIIADTSAQYSVRIKEPGGCSAYDTIGVAFNEFPPVPVIVASGDSLLTNAAGKLQWYRNGQAMANDSLNYIIPNQPGNYSVVVTNPAGCSSESLPFNLTSVRKFNGKSAGWLVSPNPFSAYISITLPGQSGDGHLSLYNLLGIRLKNWQVNGEKTRLSAEDLPPGTYLLRYEESGLSQRLMKQ